ncbi:hypothetical protein [Enterococcus diestrammenae]|uniref:hypothetical protein n=1 Tax=Enterococcus diestrammenae TaxID=1155073 RepID=UPI001958F90D
MLSKLTKLAFLLFSLLLIFTGCNSENSQKDLTKIPESKRLLYSGNRELSKDQIGEQLGEVKQNIDPDKSQQLNDWESQNLPVGTRIYCVVGRIDDAEGDYFAYEKQGHFYLFYEFFGSVAKF